MTPVSYIQDAPCMHRGQPVSHAAGDGQDPARSIAQRFVAARLAATPLAGFPGVVPTSLDSAYRCQDLAIALWPDEVVGWKVGWIPDEQQRIYGEERLVGPIFRRALHPVTPGATVDVPVFQGGFAAVEAEYVFRIGAAAPADKLVWSDDEAAAVVGAMFIGIEPASSPLATINDLGPAVVVSDFGNNAGLLLGPEIPDWRPRLATGMTCETFIEGRSVGRGGTERLPKGPLGALAFALARCARRGRALQAGQYVSTGAASGIHDIRPGESAAIVFDGLGTLACRAVAALPSSSPQHASTSRGHA
jgi:2-keto-4-pentenoate hydratase